MNLPFRLQKPYAQPIVQQNIVKDDVIIMIFLVHIMNEQFAVQLIHPDIKIVYLRRQLIFPAKDLRIN